MFSRISVVARCGSCGLATGIISRLAADAAVDSKSKRKKRPRIVSPPWTDYAIIRRVSSYRLLLLPTQAVSSPLPHDHGGELVPDDPELEGLALPALECGSLRSLLRLTSADGFPTSSK